MSATPGYTSNRTPASARGGALGPQGIIDCDAASRALRRKVITRSLPSTLLTNATTSHSLGALGINGNIVSIHISFRTLPAVSGGTATFRFAIWDGSAQTFLCASTDLLTGLTARVGNPVTLAPTTEPNVLAANALEWVVVVSNNAVSTQPVDGHVTIVYDPTEPTVITQ